MQQEVFDFHKIERLEWSDFIESDENRNAILYLIRWPNWNSNGIIIHGESGTGKTHLAALWAQTANAVYVLEESLNHNPRELFYSEYEYEYDGRVCGCEYKYGVEHKCNFVIDNFDDIVSHREHHDWMFHFFNIAKEKNRSFIILSRTHPSLWDIELEDLKSRLFTLPVVSISPPNDCLLLKISQKIAKDLGINISDDVMIYILNLIERKVDAISSVLKILDKLSLQQQKTISVSFVKKHMTFLKM